MPCEVRPRRYLASRGRPDLSDGRPQAIECDEKRRIVAAPDTAAGDRDADELPVVRGDLVLARAGGFPVQAARRRVKQRKPRGRGAFPSAPKRTRTSTGFTSHKALNLARLPIPPPAQEGSPA